MMMVMVMGIGEEVGEVVPRAGSHPPKAPIRGKGGFHLECLIRAAPDADEVEDPHPVVWEVFERVNLCPSSAQRGR